MTDPTVSRRHFLHSAGIALWLGGSPRELGDAFAAAAKARSGAQIPYRTLTPEQADDMDAIAARIIPSDDTLPGAREARAVVFIDRALAGHMSGLRDAVLRGLADLNERAGARFSSLTDERQTELLTEIEDSAFFGQIRYGVVVGTFAHPDWGGNHEEAGWTLLGFESRSSWTPPFGEYDAEVNR